MQAEPRRHGRVHQVARIGGAHLEQHPQLEIAQRLPVEPAVDVLYVSHHTNAVDAQAGPSRRSSVNCFPDRAGRLRLDEPRN